MQFPVSAVGEANGVLVQPEPEIEAVTLPETLAATLPPTLVGTLFGTMVPVTVPLIAQLLVRAENGMVNVPLLTAVVPEVVTVQRSKMFVGT